MSQIRMRGAGYYSAHQTPLVIDRTLPLMLDALRALDPASSSTVFAIPISELPMAVRQSVCFARFDRTALPRSGSADYAHPH